MRRTILILNLLAAVGFVCLSQMAAAAQDAFGISVYHEFVVNNVLVEHPTYQNGEPFKVESRMRDMGDKEYLSLIGFLAAGACAVNGIAFFFLANRELRNVTKP